MFRHRKRPSEDLTLLLLAFPGVGLVVLGAVQESNVSITGDEVQGITLPQEMSEWDPGSGHGLHQLVEGQTRFANLLHITLIQKLFVLWVSMSQVQLLLDISLQCMRKYELWLKLFHGWDLSYLHCPMNSHNRFSLQHLNLLVRATNRISEIIFLWEFCLCQAIFNWAGDSSRCWGRTCRFTPSQPAQAPLQHFHGKQSPSSIGLY